MHLLRQLPFPKRNELRTFQKVLTSEGLTSIHKLGRKFYDDFISQDIIFNAFIRWRGTFFRRKCKLHGVYIFLILIRIVEKSRMDRQRILSKWDPISLPARSLKKTIKQGMSGTFN